MGHKQQQKGVIVLIAPEFDEERTVVCVSRMRRAGIAIELIGIHSGVVRGHRGVGLRADASLEELPGRLTYLPLSMIILCGQQECAARLMADPRVHRLIQDYLDEQGKLVCLSSENSACAQIFQTVTNTHQQWLAPVNLSYFSFVDQLINKLIA